MAFDLKAFSDALAHVVDQAGAGVVRIDARRRFGASGIAWSADGLIVTANHVVERDENITIGLPGGEEAGAELIGRDPTTDLAVLRLANASLTPLSGSKNDQLKVGHLVIALGRPGRRVMADTSTIQILGDGWRTSAGGTVDQYIQTGIEMLPGFSGGPLLDTSGALIGLNTSGITREGGITIPYTTLDRVVKQLKEHGHVQRGYLGVGTQPVRIPGSVAQSLGQETGLLIVSVEPGSPAESGGLLLGDTIVRMGSDPIRTMDDFVAGLTGDRIGQTVPLQVIRGGQVVQVPVTLGERI